MKGTHPDQDQIGVEWVDIRQLDDIRLYPRAIADILRNKVTHVR
ncbi:hypothetical protein FHS19_001482 [Paenibacillus rhizosphaerae]|uniref:NUDIX hydrolase n=1 Tax=Paenibacillus rhizosphaerae TaxID=297318 RepID=A0A839TN38_9BACL|nr:hypothetical protein [Paenibacillus rhizosphaerae]